MSKPAVCPKCDTVSKPRAVRCRTCGTRLAEPAGKQGTRHSTDYHALVFDGAFRVTRILS